MSRWRTFRQVNIYLGALAFFAGVAHSSRARASAPQCSQVLLLRRDASRDIEKQIEELARLKYEIDVNMVDGPSYSIVTNVITKHYPALFTKFIQESGISEAEAKLRVGQKIVELQREKYIERDERQHKETNLHRTIQVEHSHSLSLPFALTGEFNFVPEHNLIVARASQMSSLFGNKLGAATVTFDVATGEHRVIQSDSQLAAVMNDRKTILSLNTSGDLIFAETQTGKMIQSLKTEFTEQVKIESWAISPDENLLAFNSKKQIVVVSLVTGETVARSSTEFLNSAHHASQMRFINNNELYVHDIAKGLARFTVDDSRMKFIVEGDFSAVIFDDHNRSVMLAPYMASKHPGKIYDFGSGGSTDINKYFKFGKMIPGTSFFFGKSIDSKYFSYGIYNFGHESATITINRPELISEWSGVKGVDVTGATSGGDYLILHRRERSILTQGALEFFKIK